MNECEIAVYHNKKLHSYSIPKNKIIKNNIFITWARRISFILTYHTYAKLILVALLFALFMWWSMEEWKRVDTHLNNKKYLFKNAIAKPKHKTIMLQLQNWTNYSSVAWSKWNIFMSATIWVDTIIWVVVCWWRIFFYIFVYFIPWNVYIRMVRCMYTTEKCFVKYVGWKKNNENWVNKFPMCIHIYV